MHPRRRSCICFWWKRWSDDSQHQGHWCRDCSGNLSQSFHRIYRQLERRTGTRSFYCEDILKKHTAVKYGQKTIAMAKEQCLPFACRRCSMLLNARKLKKVIRTINAVNLCRISCNHHPEVSWQNSITRTRVRCYLRLGDIVSPNLVQAPVKINAGSLGLVPRMQTGSVVFFSLHFFSYWRGIDSVGGGIDFNLVLQHI